MNGPIAQIVALTCYGNAAIKGMHVPNFFPNNSTCQFCDFVKFVEFKKTLLGPIKEVTVADTPDIWIGKLAEHKARYLQLWQVPRNDQNISDRASAGFVGGGRLWRLEVALENGESQFWTDRWVVGDKNNPNKKIWHVTYGLVEISQTKSQNLRPLQEIMADYNKALVEIHSFAVKQDCGDFWIRKFADALRVLDDPDSDIGYHKDLFLPNALQKEAISILKATMSSSVFGGMGSWNDMGFSEEVIQKEYERVSDALFKILNEAISAAASSGAAN